MLVFVIKILGLYLYCNTILKFHSKTFYRSVIYFVLEIKRLYLLIDLFVIG